MVSNSGAAARSINPEWSVVVSESALAVDIAVGGGGIAYCLRERVAPLIDDETLREVLPHWSSMGEAFHIYYPSRRQQPEALRALISMLKRSGIETASRWPQNQTFRPPFPLANFGRSFTFELAAVFKGWRSHPGSPNASDLGRPERRLRLEDVSADYTLAARC